MRNRPRQRVATFLWKIFVGAACMSFPSLEAATVEATTGIFAGTATTIRGKTGTAPQYTFFSPVTVQPPLYAGTISGLGSATLTDSDATWTDDQFNGMAGPCYVRFQSGLQVDIVDTLGSSRTLLLARDVPGEASNGEGYWVRQHATIGTLFGPHNEAGLLAASRPQDADVVILYWADSQLSKSYFFCSTAGFVSWWDFAGHPANDVVIAPGAGIIVQRRSGTDLTLFHSGMVEHGPCQLPIVPGINLVGTLNPNVLTLADLGLYTGDVSSGIGAAANPATGDKLVIVNSNGSTTSYFYYKTASYQGWLNFAAQPSDSVTIPCGGAFYLMRQLAHGPFSWALPVD